MATRNRLQRGEDLAAGVFEGRVRIWRKQWLTAGPTRDGQKLLFNVWRPTEDRSCSFLPRSDLFPVPTPGAVKTFIAEESTDNRVGKRKKLLSHAGGLDHSTTPAVSEGGSVGATLKTEGAAPKVIRLKLKSSMPSSNATYKSVEQPSIKNVSESHPLQDGATGGETVFMPTQQQ